MNSVLDSLNKTTNPSASFSDKLLGKDVSARIQELIKKDLTRDELLELLYLLTADELKLTNLSEYDRYLLGKFFTWIRDFVKLGEFIFDLEIQIAKSGNKELQTQISEIRRMVLHNIKFSVDIYLYLMRSTLGVKAFAFESFTKAKYEYEYNQSGGNVAVSAPEKKKLFG